MNNNTDIILDLPTSTGFGDKIPRVRDVDLGKWLEYGEPLECRRAIRKLLDEKNLNRNDVLEVLTETSKRGGRPSVEYWLRQAEAITVAVLSKKPRGKAMLDQLIAIFQAAKQSERKFAFVEARILQFQSRRTWTRVWTEEVVKPICQLYGWPVRNVHSNTSSFYAPLASVIDKIYRTVLGEDTVDEIRKRLKSAGVKRPSQGRNVHQLFEEEVLDLMRDDLRTIVTIVEQSGTREDFWMRMARKFQRGMLQTSMDTMSANDKRKKSC